ncbi:MAG: flavodoxin domain-containing protein [Tepidiformaceae bacterium]
MKVLVAFASRHGATTGIATAIAETMRGDGLEVDLLPVEQVADVSGYDGVVLGSAVYLGHWLTPARMFVVREAVELRQRPVWLFSSGPVGDPLQPVDFAVDVADSLRLTRARGHQLFAGQLDRAHLAIVERVLASALRVREGDFRDWSQVRAWATGIADELGRESVAARLAMLA